MADQETPLVNIDPSAGGTVAMSSQRPLRNLVTDAFFADEAGPDDSLRSAKPGAGREDCVNFNAERMADEGTINSGFKLNRFGLAPALRDYNPLENLQAVDPDTLLRKQRDPAPGSANQRDPPPDDARWINLAFEEELGFRLPATWFIHVPASFSADVAKVTILFGVGADMPRHGIRFFFEGTTDRVLINVPGTEGHSGTIRRARAVRLRWGVGVTSDQIDQLFALAGKAGQKWEISTLAAFSTGYRGLFSTAINTLPHPNAEKLGAPGTGLEEKLRNLEKVVIFDALYKDDLSKAGPRHTAVEVFTQLTKIATNRDESSPIRLIVYDVTGAGTSWTRPIGKTFTQIMPADVASKYAVTVIDTKTREFDLPNNPSLTKPSLAALYTVRLLKEGIRDHYFTADTIKQFLRSRQGDKLADALDGLLAALDDPRWQRGKVASSTDTADAEHQVFTGWISDADLAAYVPFQNLLNDEFVQKYELLGWSAWNLGETCHDAQMVEFGWEHLPR